MSCAKFNRFSSETTTYCLASSCQCGRVCVKSVGGAYRYNFRVGLKAQLELNVVSRSMGKSLLDHNPTFPRNHWHHGRRHADNLSENSFILGVKQVSTYSARPQRPMRVFWGRRHVEEE